MNPTEINDEEINTEQQLVPPMPGKMKDNEGKKEKAASGASAAVAAQTNEDRQDVDDRDDGKDVAETQAAPNAEGTLPPPPLTTQPKDTGPINNDAESVGALDGDGRFILAHSANDIINFTKGRREKKTAPFIVVTDAGSRSTIEHDLNAYVTRDDGYVIMDLVQDGQAIKVMCNMEVIPSSFNEVVGRVFMLHYSLSSFNENDVSCSFCAFAAAGVRGNHVKEMQFCEALLLLTGYYSKEGRGDISVTLLGGAASPPDDLAYVRVAVSLAEGLPFFAETIAKAISSLSKQHSPEKKATPSQVQRTTDNKMLCWGCGVESSKELKRCSRCIADENSVPGRYCSKECQKENWKLEHRSFHKDRDQQMLTLSKCSSSAQTENNKMACWGCGAESSQKLNICNLCVTENVYAPARFCSKECQKANWKRHKLAHEHRKKGQDARNRQDKIDNPDGHVSLVGRKGYLWEQHSWAGNLCMNSGDCKGAVKNYKKAVKAAPDEPSPYLEMAIALMASMSYVGAQESFLNAAKRYPKNSFGWALAVCGFVPLLLQLGNKCCKPEELPEWARNWEKLKMVSSKVIDAIVYRKTGEVTRCTSETELKEHQARAWSTRSLIYGTASMHTRNIPDMIEAIRCVKCSCKLAEGRPDLQQYKKQLATYQKQLMEFK
jgi:tetratricopeptide (TPR) repeat protein